MNFHVVKNLCLKEHAHYKHLSWNVGRSSPNYQCCITSCPSWRAQQLMLSLLGNVCHFTTLDHHAEFYIHVLLFTIRKLCTLSSYSLNTSFSYQTLCEVASWNQSLYIVQVHITTGWAWVNPTLGCSIQALSVGCIRTSWPAQQATCITHGYCHHVCQLPCPTVSLQLSKYIQQWDNTWATLTVASFPGPTHPRKKGLVSTVCACA